ncbi:formate dehydrogenase accessory sulfurtransferase FdhD [Helicobacter kayseriensis]|uniref:formate dehydrogenase accessory sulfurtransferase FdhD n=1 Tax=Helicobacter kayseriensis TaxID=2905877 RepID=UPI001E52441C|nr:formate dehydrogenase accessory sulfurtransferase FdhD [Helicobacter kayseriensis]MCE3047530.1 formate dehydrogenase accessory sulfurtransferase FdhD [Helicobacter kayseriensis]MCE3048852.1 formate dehydrogenase accessory sulfurtransferase FdhD [Helicobacter kayseriensis]
MEVLKKINIVRFEDGNQVPKEDIVILESRVNFYLNGEKIISTMCIPQDEDAHMVGFLLSEGVIDGVGDITSLEVRNSGLEVWMEARSNQKNLINLYKEKTLVSGCGGGITGNTGNQIEIEFNASDLRIEGGWILEHVKRFYQESELYLQTGCVHKAMLLFANGEFLESEDIGRHNAIDKVCGKARLKEKDPNEGILIVSGRLSSEMVTKAVMHRIPIVVSRTAPTFLGVKTAQMHGITLCGFARGKNMNIYTHPSRILF